MPLEVNPSRVSFGRINVNSPTQYQTVSIHAGETGKIAPELIPGKQGKVDAQLCEIEPGQHYELEVSVSPPWSPSSIRETLRLKTGVAEAPEMSIFVSGTIGSGNPPRKRAAAGQPSKPTRNIRKRGE